MASRFYKTSVFGELKKGKYFYLLKQVCLKRASGMIKFLAESCLSGLGIVLKEP